MMFWYLWCVCMFDLVAGTQVHYRSSIPGVYSIRGRSSSFVVHSFVLDLNHSDQRNSFCPQKVKYFCLQIWRLCWEIVICISWSDLPQFFNSCSNPGSFSNSLQSDLLFDSVDFGLKLPDLSRSKLFRPFMLFFILNPSFFSLIWSISNLIFHSPLCFGYIHGTALMLLARSGATTWTLLAIGSATAWVPLSRSGAHPELLCQDPSSTVLGRPCSKTSFSSFFAKIWVCLLSALQC